jgi:hypothetical protein
MKVYLATSGEYSDYRVQHVFTRREDAEEYPLGDDVEERELRDGPVEVRFWHALIWRANHPDEVARDFCAANPYQSEECRDFDGRPGHIQHHWAGPPERTGPILYVEGWDREGVLKVYSEQRAQHLARKANLV